MLVRKRRVVGCGVGLQGKGTLDLTGFASKLYPRHVINDQDVVPRGGKFVTMYKRNGHRVIVNRAGGSGHQFWVAGPACLLLGRSLRAIALPSAPTWAHTTTLQTIRLDRQPPSPGDLIVRPTPFESSLIQAPLGSNPLHHLLSGYQGSMTAVGRLADGLSSICEGLAGTSSARPHGLYMCTAVSIS